MMGRESHTVLFEANALTSAIVDCIHGVLPSSNGPVHNRRKARIERLTRELLELSKETIRKVSEWNNAEHSKKTFQLWHDICLLRRIIARINTAFNGKLSAEALAGQKTTITQHELSDYCRVNQELTNLVVNKGYAIIRENKSESAVNWWEIAVIYESTLVLRARGLIAPALMLANQGSTLKIHEKAFMPEDVKGLISFSPLLFSEIQPSTEADATEAELWIRALFEISKRITLNSKNAASQTLKEFEQNSDKDKLKNIFNAIRSFIRDSAGKLHISSVLHIESTLRVMCHNLVNETRPFVKTDKKDQTATNGDDDNPPINQLTLRLEFSTEIIDLYEKLTEAVDSVTTTDAWMKEMVLSKLKQDRGILLSNIVPAILLEMSKLNYFKEGIKERKISKDVVEEIQQKSKLIEEYIEMGWDDERDCPARIRGLFRKASMNDMFDRSASQGNPSGLGRLIRLIGDPRELNPFTSKVGLLPRWIWGVEENHKSKHLQYFPQSSINQSQISILMAYMQLILKEPDENNYFGNLEKMFNQEGKNSTWKVSGAVKNRPQFSIGHLKGNPNNKPFVSHRLPEPADTKAQLKKNILSRKNVNRVNRMDPLMFAATSMNLIEHLIADQAPFNIEDRLDRAARQSSVDTSGFPSSLKSIHIHDIIHAAQEAAQAPMRVLQHDGNSKLYDKAQLVDQMLRVSFARLYVLTARVEQIARLLLEQPLRQPYQDSSVLVIDQVRVLLKFMHSEWLKSEATYFENNPELHQCEINDDILSRLKILIKQKGHLGIHFNPLKFDDRHDKELIRGDLDLEYLLSNGLPRRGPECSMVSILEKSRTRLNFEGIHYEDWTSFIQTPLSNKFEGPYELTPEEYEELMDVLDVFDEDAPSGSANTLPNTQETIERAFQRIRENTDREWILWSRLVLFPVVFDGRTIVSSTTFRDINTHQDKPAMSLLWGQLKDGYLSDSEENE